MVLSLSAGPRSAHADPPPAPPVMTPHGVASGSPSPPSSAPRGEASSASPAPSGASTAPDVDLVPRVMPPTSARDTNDFTTPRYEPAGFPLIGGNSDVGVLIGAAGTLTRFERGIRPYFWNMDLVVALSLRDGPHGVEINQQNYRWQLDMAGLFGGRVRLNAAAYYQRTVDQGYYGLGNGSGSYVPGMTIGQAHYFEFTLNDVRVFQSTRFLIRGPFSVAFATIYRFADPRTPDCLPPQPAICSLLALDATRRHNDGTPWIRGLQPLSLVEISARAIYETRDDEIMPTRGVYHQLWVRGVQGIPFDANVGYVAVGASLAQYFSIGGPFVFASRVTAEAEFGNVPFYDLFRGGTPFPTDMVGGGESIRGVPSGRYLGPLRVIGNAEIRGLFGGFSAFGQSFRVGANLFFDAGRMWSDYTFSSPLDGTGLGLKWGTGLGGYLRWGQAAIFRAEIAYSPDQQAINPGFPFAIYVEDGVMF